MTNDTYVVLKDGATVHHVDGPLTNADGDEIGVAVTSVVHAEGDEIPGSELPDYVKSDVAADGHAATLLAKKDSGKKLSGVE